MRRRRRQALDWIQCALPLLSSPLSPLPTLLNTDWSTLISIDFGALLPGKLTENEVDAAALVPLLMDPNRSADMVLREIFDMLTPAHKGKWMRGDSLRGTICGGGRMSGRSREKVVTQRVFRQVEADTELLVRV
ncbi:hypothetical protein DFH06DRAFT_1125366 [Mycena polygramma]|nr:hypothetical protein DFH06DRAFT_1125366 [Mycena polygramma]